MPQADISSFRATLLLLPIIFLVGYYFFATVWVPRLLCTLKARAWLTRVEAVAWPVTLTGGEQWPEIFLMFIQFGGLIWVISKVSLVTTLVGLPKLTSLAIIPTGYLGVGGAPVENFFYLWNVNRQHFFFAPAGAALTITVVNVLQSFSFYSPGKQFPFLLDRLRQRLPLLMSAAVTRLGRD